MIGYRAAHMRLGRERGPASNYPCQLCLEQPMLFDGPPQMADDWAYTHDDPDGLLGSSQKAGEGDSPYSIDPRHYIPLCQRCHYFYDKFHDRTTRWAWSRERAERRRTENIDDADDQIPPLPLDLRDGNCSS